ncbi:MAG: ribosome silencing factor [Candidatus Omnitrophica bacterium]|nr:ribosome silencing factor [Candidatus Omnitrophota bacterium]
MEAKRKAGAIARAASSKKALDIVIIDMRKMPGICDFFLIASGTSTTQVRAISDNIQKKLKESGGKLYHIEGEKEALWVLLDYGDVVGHVFYDPTRRFYDLERLWADAPQQHFKERVGKKIRHAKRKKKKRRS